MAIKEKSWMSGKTRKAFMEEVADAAVADWRERHICLPSLVIAIMIEGGGRFWEECNGKGKRTWESVPVLVRSHNDYLATWKGEGQQRPNWEKVRGECYYILAVQYLQDAEYPYSVEKEYEEKIVGRIEGDGLVRYDGS